jgi:hypothetical protein
METNKERLTSEERVKGRESAERGEGGKMKCIRLERLEELRGTTTMIDPSDKGQRNKLPFLGAVHFCFYELDNTGSSVDQSVKKLRGLLDAIGERKSMHGRIVGMEVWQLDESGASRNQGLMRIDQ